MGKGGSSKVDTSGVNAAASQEEQLAQQAAGLAQQNYNQGLGMYTGYEKPVLDQYLQILGLGPGGTSTYTDPALNQMMQPALQQGQQAATAAKKNLMNSGLGPVATATGAQQIDRSTMSNVQSGVLSQLQTMMQQLIGAGQQGTAMQTSAPGQITGAASAVGQAGSLEAQMASLEAQAAQTQNQGLSSGLSGLGTLFGLLGAGSGTKALSSMGGKGGSSGGSGAAADVSAVTDMFAALPAVLGVF